LDTSPGYSREYVFFIGSLGFVLATGSGALSFGNLNLQDGSLTYQTAAFTHYPSRIQTKVQNCREIFKLQKEQDFNIIP
jgi:hypothetical protein